MDIKTILATEDPIELSYELQDYLYNLTKQGTDLSMLSKEARNVFLCNEWNSYANSGNLTNFFADKTPEIVEETAEAYKTIAGDQISQLVADAIQSKDDENKLNDLKMQFLYHQGELEEAMFNYVMNNKQAFIE